MCVELRTRLKAYARFGAGEPVAHWSGRLIWQLADAHELVRLAGHGARRPTTRIGLARTGAVGDDRPVGYDEDLANRIRELISAEAGVSERKMFGGLAFLVGGHMSVAASGRGGLMVRVDPSEGDALLAEPHARPFEMGGREIQGWLRVEGEGVRSSRQLERWVTRGVAHARSLPPKPGHEHHE